VLLLNWNERTPDFIEQMDEICPMGSRITLVSDEKPHDFHALRLSNCRLNHVKGDPTSAASLRKLDPSSYSSLVWLQPEGGGESADSSLLVSFLAVQQALRDADSGGPTPRLVAEVSSPSMKELILSRGCTGDLLLPAELASGVLVQFALQPALNTVYSELLAAEGKEIFIAPASLYAAPGEELTCGALYARARTRGEVLMGLRRAGDSAPMLNPPKGMKVKLGEGDKLVVLGEAF